MDLKLQDKSALVSGSTKGIGFATAALLAAEGARVIINGRTEAAVNEAMAAIRSTVPRANLDGFAGDLSAAGPTAELVRRFPAVDILVNNLGIFERKPFEQCPLEVQWPELMRLNHLPVRQAHRSVGQRLGDRRVFTRGGHLNRASRAQGDWQERVGAACESQRSPGAWELDEQRAAIYRGNAANPELGVETMREVVTSAPGGRRQVRLRSRC